MSYNYTVVQKGCQVKIVNDKVHKDMYRLEWPNKDVSVASENPEYKEGHFGFYNKTRAKELIRREGIENYDRGITYNHPLGRD